MADEEVSVEDGDERTEHGQNSVESMSLETQGKKEHTKFRGPPQAIVAPLGAAFDSRVTKFKEDKVRALKIGSNGPIEIKPAILHFPGFEINKTYKQKVTILNVGSEPQRVRAFPPSTANFQASCAVRGTLGMGMSEDVMVSFTPKEYKYHYDCIRVHCKYGKPLLLPIHAYPVANEILFPEVIDFGICELGQTTMKTIPIRCKVPVDFEFTLLLLQEHPAFTVFPTHGIIPGNGKVDVTVSFTPSKMAVQRVALKLSVSQFGSEPFVCEVIGSSEPGITKRKYLEQVKKRWHSDTSSPSDATNGFPRSIDETLQVTRDESLPNETKYNIPFGSESVIGKFKADVTEHSLNQLKTMPLESFEPFQIKPKRGIGSGGVLDPGGEWLRERQLSTNSPKHCQDANIDSGTMQVDGYRIPSEVHGVQATNYILTQEPGKFKLHQLRRAIEEHREAQRQEQAGDNTAGLATHITYQLRDTNRELQASRGDQQEKGSNNTSNREADVVDRLMAVEEAARNSEGTTRQMKELSYLQYTKAVEETENRKSQSGKDSLGEELLSAEQQNSILRYREELKLRDDKKRRATERSSWKAIQSNSQHRVAYHVDWIDSLLQYQPKFDVYQNNLWDMRRYCISKLIRTIGKIIIYNRGNKRIKRIKEFLGDAKNKSDVRKLVENDARNPSALASANALRIQNEAMEQMEEWTRYKARLQDFIARQKQNSNVAEYLPVAPSSVTNQVTNKGGGTNTEATRASSAFVNREPVSLRTIGSLKLTPNDALGCVHPLSFPCFEEQSVSSATPVEVSLTQGFVDPEFFQLTEPEEYKLCSYDEMTLPSFYDHVPVCKAQPLRRGALEECGQKPSIANKKLQTLLLPVNTDYTRIIGQGSISSLIASNNRPLEYMEQRAKVAVLENIDGILSEVNPAFKLSEEPFDPSPFLTPSHRACWAKSSDTSSINMVSRFSVLSQLWRPTHQRSLLGICTGSTTVPNEEHANDETDEENHEINKGKANVSLEEMIWAPPGLPKLLDGPIDEDFLSECDSDIEGDSTTHEIQDMTLESHPHLHMDQAEDILLGTVPSSVTCNGLGEDQESNNVAHVQDLTVDELPRTVYMQVLHQRCLAFGDELKQRFPCMIRRTNQCIEQNHHKILPLEVMEHSADG